MPNFKCTAFFEMFEYGWSETYYNASVDYQTALDNLNNLMLRRRQFLSQDAFLRYTRVSDVTIFRDAIITQQPGFGAPGTYPVGPSMPSEVALRVRVQASPQQISRIFCRGIPRDCVTDDQFIPTGAFTTAFGNFVTYLINPFTNFVLQTLNNGFRGITYPFTNGIAATPRGFSISTPVQLGGADFAYISRTGVPGVNGLKAIVSSSLTGPPYTMVLAGGSPEFANVFTGDISTRKYTYEPVVSCVFEELTRRAPGRPFDQRAGRRRSLIPLRR